MLWEVAKCSTAGIWGSTFWDLLGNPVAKHFSSPGCTKRHGLSTHDSSKSNIIWLVVWNMNGLFVHSVGNFIIPMKSIHFYIFFRVGLNHQPDRKPYHVPSGNHFVCGIPLWIDDLRCKPPDNS